MPDERELYMQRCVQLAALGAGQVAPNPMVGAVLVHGNRIIGEGYHEQYGKAHAEVNCLASVRETDRHLIPQAELYVSLEPCAHYGKTPPCADLIIKYQIPKVFIGTGDPFKDVNGRGIERLRAAGVEVVTGVLEQECLYLNRRFFAFHTKHRPYVVLKWAQTADNKIANISHNRLVISNNLTDRIVHKWRSEETAILVGTNTVEKDDPQLTNRLWVGRNPVRLIVDLDLRLSSASKVFNAEAPAIIFNLRQNSVEFSGSLANKVYYYQVTNDVSLIPQILNASYRSNIQSVLVEGGGKILQSFIDENLWDEARKITNRDLTIGEGLPAPELTKAERFAVEEFGSDRVEYFSNPQ